LTYDLTLYTYLAPSKVCSGVGVFSLCDIPKGTVIWKKRQEAVKVPWNKIPEWMDKNIVSLTWCDKEGFWIDCDLDRIYQAYYVNHSDNANVRLGKLGEYITTRVIQKNEEILFNYPLEHQIWK